MGDDVVDGLHQGAAFSARKIQCSRRAIRSAPATSSMSAQHAGRHLLVVNRCSTSGASIVIETNQIGMQSSPAELN
jgi:hypothetical protein